MREGLKDKVISGIFWSAGSVGGRQAFQFLFLIILTRLLAPTDYGLVAMATALIGVGAVFSDIGLSSALVQRKIITSRHISTAYIMNLIMGTIIVVILVSSSPLIVKFYNNQEVGPIFKILSFSILFRSMVTVDKNLLTKTMEFKKLAIVEFISQLTSGIIAVGMALSGWGVWSLVFRSIIGSLIELVGFSVLRKHKIIFHWDTKCFRELWSFGGGHFGARILNYFSRNLDNIIIGKFLGEVALGYYNIAYRIMLKPMQLLGAVLYRVLFSAFSKLQEDPKRFRRAYLDTLTKMSLFLFPIHFFVLIMGKEIILAISGPNWIEAGPIIQILAFVGLIQSITGPTGYIYTGMGKTYTMFLWNILVTITYSISFIIGINFGIIGVASCYALANIILFYPYLKIPYRYINLHVSNSLKAITPILISSICTFIVVLAVNYSLSPKELNLFIYLFISGFMSMIFYFILLYLIKPELIISSIELFSSTNRSGTA